MYMSSSLSSSSIQDRQCNNMHTEESQTICETIRFSLHIHSSLQEKNNRSNSLLCHIKCEMRNAHACWRIHTWRHDAMLDEYKKKTNRKDINSMHIQQLNRSIHKHAHSASAPHTFCMMLWRMVTTADDVCISLHTFISLRLYKFFIHHFLGTHKRCSGMSFSSLNSA